jgi:hypothetical protein
MIKNFTLTLLLFCQILVFAQDKNVMKITKYIQKGKDTEAKELLDKLDNKPEYQSDIYYWFVRTICYRNIARSNTNATTELAEARKSFEKLIEYDKKDPSKTFTENIPQLRKDLYDVKNNNSKSVNNSQTGSISQGNDNGKTVTLTQIGQGKTKDAAKYNALRNAIEKAFGTFISSNTTLLNDELLNDEIVSVSTGNIQNFEILSETQMPDGTFSSVLKATVSIGKLAKFCESKGISVEFKGGIFATNIKLQELNKNNEESVMKNLYIILNKISAKGFDYTIDVSEPRKEDSFADNWIVDFSVTAKANNNLENIKEITMETINNICLSPQEIITYSNQNLSRYRIKVNGKDYYFRSSTSLIYLRTIFEKKIPLASLNFSVSDGINTNDCISLIETNLQVGKTISKKSDWPCLSSSSQDCGYRGSIKAKYFILHSPDENPSGAEQPDPYKIQSFLSGINKSNFQQINNSYCDYNSNASYSDLNLDQLNYSEVPFKYKLSSNQLEILYCFSRTYTMEQLSKITEYKITPLLK